jgi:subtilisin family serine protease
LLERLRAEPDVEYAEPNYILYSTAVPNDPLFANLWGLLNTGVNPVGGGGTSGADIDVSSVWDTATGSRTHVVGVVDTGIDYTHPDLAANVWSAPSTFQVTVGGQTITCQAGTHGFNAITRTCDARDDNDHGTHVAGTVGAVGGNGAGVAGVNWTASLMALKFLDAAGNGYTSDAINAIEFAIQARVQLGTGANVRVLSSSWGGPGASQALADEIARAADHDMLFVASAGNSGADNDAVGYYPANYAIPNVVSVAATDNRDALAPFSNYGATTVHLAAPGVSILSTVRGAAYAYGSGTSMAVPHVSGAALLALAACGLGTAGLKAVLLDNTDLVPSLAGFTATGGRLDAGSVLAACRAAAPAPDFSVTASPASVSVKRGKTASYTVTVAAQNGFSSPVALAVGGYPPGATVVLKPSSVTGSGTATLSVKTTGAAKGTYTLTILGTATGLSRSTAATLIVG